MIATTKQRRKGGMKMVRNWNPRIEQAHNHTFQAGEPVTVLYQGRHDGMDGHYLGLAQDPNWAKVEDSTGLVSSHPLVWLRPSIRAASALTKH